MEWRLEYDFEQLHTLGISDTDDMMISVRLSVALPKSF